MVRGYWVFIIQYFLGVHPWVHVKSECTAGVIKSCPLVDLPSRKNPYRNLTVIFHASVSNETVISRKWFAPVPHAELPR